MATTGNTSSPKSDTGFVYVLSNPSMPGLVKIGETSRLPEDRLPELYTTGVPLPFEVEFRVFSMRRGQLEKHAHDRLAVHRVSGRREFFRASVADAIEAVRQCALEIDGIDAWEPAKIHQLRRGDRVAVQLEADQLITRVAQPGPLSGAWDIVDVWQAHSNGDLLEMYVSDDPAHVSGLSDGDPDAHEDPVPFVNRTKDAANGCLIGKEKLVPGDRLIWLSDNEDPRLRSKVIFEAYDYCQISCRTWSPRWTAEGYPLILNALMYDPSPRAVAAVRSVLAMAGPRNWVPHETDTSFASLREKPDRPGPEFWLPQLNPRPRRRKPRGHEVRRSHREAADPTSGLLAARYSVRNGVGS